MLNLASITILKDDKGNMKLEPVTGDGSPAELMEVAYWLQIALNKVMYDLNNASRIIRPA